MNILTIVTSRYGEALEKYILRKENRQILEKLGVGCKVQKAEGLLYFYYFIPNKLEDGESHKKHINNTLSFLCRMIKELIKSHILYDMIKDISNTKYRFISSTPLREEVYHHVNREMLYKKKETISLERYMEKEIWDMIIDCFQSKNEFVIEGFVKFRLKEVYEQLEKRIEQVIREYRTIEEYKSFINLLKNYVDVQETKMDTLHVIGMEDQSFRMLNQYKQDITQQCIDSFHEDFQGMQSNYDDILIGSLISLAPEQIIIHSNEKMENKQLLETICNIFEKRIFFCSSCEICNSLQYVHS